MENVDETMKKNSSETSFPLGEMLISAGHLNSKQLDFALQKQKVTGERLGDLLMRLGIVAEYDIAVLLAKQRGLPMQTSAYNDKPDAKVLLMFNQEMCLKEGFLPLRQNGEELEVLLGNASASKVSQTVLRVSGLRPKFTQAPFNKVMVDIRHHYYFAKHQIETLLAQEVELLSVDHDQVHNPEVMINHLLHFAARERASDIHIQPEQHSAHISFRVDGVLRPIIAMPRVFERLVASIKILSNMDIAEQRLPQDGSFSTRILDITYDVRVSTILSDFGENMVLRLLPGGQQVRSLASLGFIQKDVEHLKALFSQPSGIVLLTGPTGSGKSTTLYAGLRGHGLTGRNILTVEDPIEYKFPIICQTEVNQKAGYTFEKAIKHFLRHDPDVMLIGEIRDTETAKGAITAAETGHLVLSTLHIKDVFGVAGRLRALGVHPHMVANSLIGVVSQRLLRRICPACRETYNPTADELDQLEMDNVAQLYRGRGCENCGGTGYHERLPIYEILEVNKVLANGIANEADAGELERIALADGFRNMHQMAQQCVVNGETTVSEMLRVLGTRLK